MRESAFRGSWKPNNRPHVTVTPDVYVTIQGETSVIGCPECKRKINLNDYVTSVSTEASVDSPPGSSTVTLSVPDTDVNNFFVDGELVIRSMMEIELYSKGYYLVGGMPVYYRIFWGVVSSVSKSWSGGVTTIQISCKDILRWWELTNSTLNPAFLEPFGSSAGNYQLFQNQFAGMNPYTVIISLAREAMGDFSLTTGSFQAFQPEKGAESASFGALGKDLMTYWQLKFGNIWNSLVLYGTSGKAYTFRGTGETVSPIEASAKIFQEEETLNFQNQETSAFKINPSEVSTFKQELTRTGDVEFFQSEVQSKLALAKASAEQAGYEFYCDCNGDIVFKPPFYNLNVMPNKPVSWIQDFEIMDDSIQESEEPVVTHLTSSGNAFGGTMDYGLNDEITTPRSGVYDFHLLRQYGWRRQDIQLEWAGNPRKLFFHLLDHLDKLNAKRHSGTITIPIRPELRLGFPIWIPQHDSFFYVQGISHQYSAGGQATTTLTLTAKRSKFIAPGNIGEIEQTGAPRNVSQKAYVSKADTEKGVKPKERKIRENTWKVTFPDGVNPPAGLSQDSTTSKPIVIRDPKTGKTLGYPNAVMVYRSTVKNEAIVPVLEQQTGNAVKMSAAASTGSRPTGNQDMQANYKRAVADQFRFIASQNRSELVARLRAHRYESGMSNMGAYEYAFDRSRNIREMTLIPLDHVDQGGVTTVVGNVKEKVEAQQSVVTEAKKKFSAAVKDYDKASAELLKVRKARAKASRPSATPSPQDPAIPGLEAKLVELGTIRDRLNVILTGEQEVLTALQATGGAKSLTQLNMLVRPVSDEFGFEVIGHYRYGRGAFIDRGQLKVQSEKSSDLANQLQIQFSPFGGFMTDSTPGATLDPEGVNFTAQFEKMQPQDYVTGASFKGFAGGSSGTPSDVVKTSQQTYTNLISANTGKGVFIEADTTRSAKTLAEMTPNMDLFGTGDDSSANCACGLGRSNWLTILPQSVIEEILLSNSNFQGAKSETLGLQDKDDSVTLAAKAEINKDIDASIATRMASAAGGGEGLAEFTATMEASRSQRLAALQATTPSLRSADKGSDAGRVFIGTSSYKGFFARLQQYLSETFLTSYEKNNATRERNFTGLSRGVTNTVVDGPEQDNILGTPESALFSRAAEGDPSALQALASQANFNFGRSEEASKAFATAWDDGGKSIAATNFSSSGFSQSSASAGQYQPPAASYPVTPISSPTIGTALLSPSLAQPLPGDIAAQSSAQSGGVAPTGR